MFAFGLGAKIAGVLAVLMLLGAGGFYWYYNHTQNRLELQASQIATYQQANDSLRRTIERKDQELERQIRGLNELNREVSTIRREAGELAELLARHDLERLAAARPGLIERRVNDGTKQVFQQLRDLSKPERYAETRDER